MTLLLILSSQVFGQFQTPVFLTKDDSLRFAFLGAQLIKTPGSNNARRDSLSKLQQQLLSTRVRYFKTTYRPALGYSTYRDLLKEANPRRISRLSLQGQNFDRIPDSVFLCTNLEALELYNTSIRALPDRLKDLKKLRKLILFSNGRVIYTRLDSLRILEDHSSRQRFRASELRNFPNLHHLDLGGNQLSDVPRLRSKTLRRITLSYNPIHRPRLTRLKTPLLRDLEFVTCQMRSLDRPFPKLDSLKKLNLNSNWIESVGGLQQFANLEVLSMYRNRLKAIPASVFELRNLAIIDLYYNEITTVPADIRRLGNLEILYLANNKLSAIPAELGSLTNLQELYLHHNGLQEVPESLASLSQLKVLRLNNNKLVVLPTRLKELKQLENLDLSFNRLSELDEQLLWLPGLRIVGLTGNPWDKSAKEYIGTVTTQRSDVNWHANP